MRNAGEVVLIHCRGDPTVYARIESINPDVKPGWYQVHLLLLTIPPQEVTWILREAYIDGEVFTMGERPMRFEEVKRAAVGHAPSEDHGAAITGPSKSATVIPFKSRKPS
jgi:hypothetical protein